MLLCRDAFHWDNGADRVRLLLEERAALRAMVAQLVGVLRLARDCTERGVAPMALDAVRAALDAAEKLLS